MDELSARVVQRFVTLFLLAVLAAQTVVAQEFNLRSLRGVSSAVPIPKSTEDESGDPTYAQWRSLRQDSTLRSVAFMDSQLGIAVGDRGVILRTTDAGTHWQAVSSPTERTLLDLVWMGPREVVVIGGGYEPITQISRGVVLRSRDAGESWTEVTGHDLPRVGKIGRLRDGALLAVGDWSHMMLGEHFISTNRGRTWNLANPSDRKRFRESNETSDALIRHWLTNRNAPPVRDICHLPSSLDPTDQSKTPQRWCSVHDHGTICTSDDEGKSWQCQRGHSRHDRVLFVAADSTDVPWALVGNEALQWRNRVSIALTHPRSRGPRDRHLAMQVAATMGAAGVDFSPPESLRSIEEEVKRLLVLHHATILVIDQSVPPKWSNVLERMAPSGGVIRVLRSERHRGDRLAGRTTCLHDRALLPRIGALVSDLTRDSLQVLAPHHQDATPGRARSIGLRRIYDVSGTSLGGGGESVAAGLPLDTGARLSATPVRISRHRLQFVQARVRQTHRLMQSLSQSSPQHPSPRDPGKLDPGKSDPGKLPSGKLIKRLLDQTAAEDRRRLAWSLMRWSIARAAQDAGKLESTMLQIFKERYGNETLGAWANLKQQASENSSERNQLRSIHQNPLRTFKPTESVAPANVNQTVAVSPFQTLRPSVVPTRQLDAIQQASAMTPLASPSEVSTASFTTPSRKGKTPTEPSRSSMVDVDFDLHPVTLIARDALDRRHGAKHNRGVELLRIAKEGQAGWKDFLADSSPRVIHAPLVPVPPQLDGRLDEDAWRRRPHEVGHSSRVRVTHNDQYVFVAIQCRAEDLHSDSVNSPARDQDLDQVDRMELSIDVDRDLLTSYRFEITDAGRTRDSIDGRIEWQPSWYFDVERDASDVTFEIAIAKDDLCGMFERDQPVECFLSVQLLLAGQTSIGQDFLPQPSHWARVTFR